MKKLLTFFLTTLLAYAVGFDVGWAATATLTQSNLGLGSYTTNTNKTIDGITYVYTDLMKNNDNIQAKATTGTIYNSTAFPGDITSVAITHSGTARATTILGSSDGTNWTQVATGSGSITGDFSSKGYKYFKITRGSNAAYWTKIEITYSDGGSQVTTYNVTCNDNVANGTISASPTSAAEGATVTLTATPDAGYQFGNWNVKDASNNSIAVNNNQFTMPASNVTVDATFTEIQSGSGEYVKVTSASDLTSGQYLIVYEDGNVAFDGGLTTLDAVSNTIGVTINSNTIPISATTTAAEFTIDTSAGTIKSASGYYIGNTSNTNALTASSTALTNSLTYNDGDIDIVSSGGAYLRYNSASNQLRFRYFKSSSYTGQKAIQLYKRVEAAVDKAYDVTVATGLIGGSVAASPSGEKVVDSGDQITVTATPATGYDLSAWNITGVSESMTSLGTTNPATVTATGNVNVSASFTQHNYKIATAVNPSNAATDGNSCAVWMQSGFTTIDNVATATYGATVSVKLHTSNGWMVDGISITGVNANDITLTNTEDDGKTYSFPMPAQDITITGNFTPYRPTLSMAGRFNGNTNWRTSGGPEFTYNSSNDEYTLDVYFTGEGDGNYFYFRAGNSDLKAANGNESNYGINDNNMSQTHSLGGSRNFEILSGVYTFTVNGALTTLNVTPKTYTIAFSPASGSEVEQGTQVTASCTLESDINAIKNTDSGAAGDVTVTCNPSTLNTVGANQQVTATATIGNYSVPGNATYTVVKANLSKTYRRTNTLTVGKKYIIVNEAAAVGFKTGGYEETITINDHQTTLADGSTVIEFTLGGQAGAYTFMSGSKYLQNPSGNTVNVASDEAKTWDVSIDGSYEATMKANATNYYLRYNSGASNNRFRAYAGNSTAAAVQLYEQAVEEEKDYTITYAEVTGGSATGAAGANEGETVTVTATPASGYACTGITVNPSATVTDNGDGTYSFTMPAANVTVTPTFVQAYAITYVAEPTAGGTVTGVASAAEADDVVVTVTPNDDYRLVSLVYSWNNGAGSQTVAGEGTAANPYHFSMPHYATTVTATFEKIPHTFTVVSANGEVTGLPETATSGTSVTFTVTPHAGYVVSSVSGTFNNGNSSLNITDNGDGTYSFNMPASDVAITVTYFASEDYELLTDLADINTEDTYLLVGGPTAGGYVNVMGKKTDNSTMGFTALTSSNYDSETGIITSNENMAVVNFLVSNGTYAIHTADGYVNESSVTASTPFYWTIDLDATSSRAQITSSNKHFSYNNSAPRWKAYNGEQGAQYIFKLANKNKVKRPSITGAAGEYLGLYNFIGKDNVSMACATDGATIEYSLDGGNTWQSYSEAVEITTNAAGNTVVVMARATKTGMEPSDAVTATFTCIKPTAPTFGTNEAGAYVNPVFVYPKSALNDRKAYGQNCATFYYVTDGSTTSIYTDDNEVTTSNSNGYYVVLDDNANLQVVTVINGIASDPAGGAYTFSVDAPAFSLPGGNYDGNQQTRLSTNTKTQQNNLSWNTVIYYTTGNTEFAFDATTGEVTSEGWVAYDPTNNPYLDILAANGTTTIKAVTLSNYFNGQTEYRVSDVTTETYVLTAANLAITVSPAAGTYVNAQSVTLGVKNEIGDYTIYYTTDGSTPSANSTPYAGAITVDHDMTIKVYAVDSRTGEGGTATAEAVYKIGIQPVVYSPFPGTIYKGDDEDINVEMFSVTPNAKIYYTVAEGEDNYPDDPTSASTLYSTPVPLETGKTYNFKAIAVIGSLVSTVTPGTFTVQAKGSGWLNVNEMANSSDGTNKTLDNPVQIVYMSTWRHNGEKPEFAFVRDNSGYGLIYFGGSNVDKYNDWTKFEMGDWLAGGTIKGTMAQWGNSFINELGGSAGTLNTWPETALGNTAILPEETTNQAIKDGWTYEGAYTGSDYASYIDPDKNLFGHYVHMRKNTISNLSLTSSKYLGQITDQSGVALNYYDGLYLFSGHNGRPTYDQTFFDNIQNKGGTFDVYAIVYFYGPNAHNAAYSNAPYEIFPIDFEWIYKPLFNIETGTYHETQTISLTCETEGAQIWYKTSEMEAYELYTGAFEVDATTTIEAYSTLPSKYGDQLESVINSITVTIGTVEAPVITEVSVVKTVGESVTTDITCTTEDATIYYTTDGSDPKTSETRIEYTLGQRLTFEETTTVRAIAMQDGYYSVEAESRTYTFVKSNGIEYTLVTEASQLNENSVYVIVNKANNMAMSTNQKTNNRDAAGVMFKNADKTIVYGNDDLAQFTLKKTGNNWYIQTNNSSKNGYLSVGNGNTLLTQATADGNAEAAITIDGTNADVDKANEAHISFIYNNETTRYMRYWNRDHLFNTYTTETNAPVFLYYVEATPLATIEKEGTTDKQYTVADELVVVHAFGNKLWVKDQGDLSIAKREKPEGQIDYMRETAASGTTNGVTVLKQEGEWDQSNWAIIEFLNSDMTEDVVAGYKGKFIKPASLTGIYSDDLNYTIQVPATVSKNEVDAWIGDAAEYTPNVFSPSNFLDANLTDNGVTSTVNNVTYFFMNPKVQEVATITYAVWDGSKFVVPAKYNEVLNGADLPGAFTPEWTYNPGGKPELTVGEAYQFLAVMNRVPQGGGNGAPRKVNGKEGNADTNKVVMPLNLNGGGGNIVTAIDDVNTANREVVGVEYYNVAGQRSDRPVEGVNIVVTRYSDGSTSTAKVLK